MSTITLDRPTDETDLNNHPVPAAPAELIADDAQGAEVGDDGDEDLPPGSYKMIKISKIDVNVNNLRTQAVASPGIVANFRQDGPAGLVHAIVVCDQPDGRYKLLAGEGRLLSAIEAGLTSIPGVIRNDLANKLSAEIATMLKENVHRVELATGEIAAGVEQLQIDGLSVAAIVKATGITRTRVKQALTVAGMGPAKHAVDGLDLPQGAIAADFAADPAALTRLCEAAKVSDDAFKKRVITETQNRDAAQRLAARAVELTAANIPVLDTLPTDRNSPIQRITELTQNGKLLTDTTHAKCPGHAAYLVTRSWDGGVSENYYCTDWKANGHGQRHRPGALNVSGPLSDEQKARNRLTRENNAAMRTANQFRRDWIRDNLLTRKTLPKGAALLIAETMVTSPYLLGRWMRDITRPHLAEFLGEAENSKLTVKATTDARCHVYVLGVIAAAHEKDIHPKSWDGPADTAAASWFTFLSGLGYPLDPIEQTIIDKVTAAAKKDAKAAQRAAAKAATEAAAKTEPVDQDVVPAQNEPAQSALARWTDEGTCTGCGTEADTDCPPNCVHHEDQAANIGPDPDLAERPLVFALAEVADAWHLIGSDGESIATTTEPKDVTEARAWADEQVTRQSYAATDWIPAHTHNLGDHLRAQLAPPL